ncbi:MAG: SPASM domain-containing protein [Cytophagaceae bacterium]|jgi:radical SAM protein with 4Fe4S-binding SPASM domain|nr:SPASM domain-containing protein [Cytophagaceae bacterium]
MWVSKDTWNILSHFTLRRSINAILVVVSFYIAKWFKLTFHPAMPIAISIEPTTSCNLRCPECPSGLRSFTRPTGMLELGNFKQCIDTIAKDIWYILFYFQGEPYLNPSFLEQVAYAKKRNLYTATSTNAHYLTSEMAKKTVESGLDRIIISIDGVSQDTYEQYRVGGSLSKVIDGTKQLLYWKKELQSSTPHIIFQFLVVAPNEKDIPAVIELGSALGVDEVRLKTAQIYQYEQGSPLIPTQEKYSRYKRMSDGSYRLKNALDNQCWKMWHQCVITWDGKVVPCCFDKDAHYSMGNVFTHSLYSIWNNTSYRDFRAQLLTSRSSIDMCRNCTEGTKIWA